MDLFAEKFLLPNGSLLMESYTIESLLLGSSYHVASNIYNTCGKGATATINDEHIDIDKSVISDEEASAASPGIEHLIYNEVPNAYSQMPHYRDNEDGVKYIQSIYNGTVSTDTTSLMELPVEEMAPHEHSSVILTALSSIESLEGLKDEHFDVEMTSSEVLCDDYNTKDNCPICSLVLEGAQQHKQCIVPEVLTETNINDSIQVNDIEGSLNTTMTGNSQCSEKEEHCHISLAVGNCNSKTREGACILVPSMTSDSTASRVYSKYTDEAVPYDATRTRRRLVQYF